MRAPAGRNLCTLAEIVRSRLIRKPNTSVESFIAPSPEFEVGFGSELKHSFEHDLAGDLVGKDESTRQISALLCSKQDKGSGYKEVDQEEKRKSALDIPWMADLSHSNLSVKRKEVMRERKHKWIFKYSCNDRFNRLIKLCAHRLGATKTVNVFSHLGRKTGVKEYNALIKVCIEKARATDDEYIAVNEMSKAFHLFKSMRDFGCPLEEQTYGPLLCYLIDMGLVQEFQLFSDVIKAENPRSASRLGYYEMLLWLRVDNEEMIRDICEFIIVDDRDSDLRASYLMALCESDKTMQLLDVVKNVDIIKLLSAECIVNIFRSLGRLQQQSVADDILLDLRTRDYDEDNISNFIVSYAVSIPNLAVGDALDIVEQMCDAGFNLSTDVLQFILQICEESFEYIWVHRIHSIICRYHLELNGEICRCLVHFCVRIKDFEGAYKIICDLEEMNVKLTANMFNAIMAGYFREKNINAGLRVLKHMQGANVDPDSQTFSYLINNCETEEDIVKYCDEMKQSGIQPTKQVFMALVHSYAACGNLEKAKQVVLDPHIPGKSLNEIKSVLVGNLVSHGQLSEALLVYEQIKKDGHKLEPKAIKCLIEELTQHNGELDALLLLLNEMSDLDYWVDGCFKVILYCARNNDLSSAMLLLKQLKDKFENDEMVLEALFDGVFSAIAASEATHLQIGLDLLWAIKDELGLRPSRQCLDFLLSACANAGDLNNARLIWREYEIAGFPYNVLSYLRMYQTLLAAGDGRSASFILKKIPRDDAEVCAVIMACEETYSALNSVGEKKEQLKRKGRKSKRKKT
ncbi:pentatricopeptide repeat-containing protein At4g04790, mitochondrial isoform X3 [Vigna radiata var. radiata]|uniref:Pentatricopeptide repeat-containing protein At4g04790, mitochondrial isoform X3 n=1 Tax=Vigna radiata var. radiata TaxID=3916 RepID=A0A3Q0ERE5_VIGRR|nr:pentatricopeptide repeat-containing protein At4g04790, mitochondrial isoform X3 [Vigna radiata var. radiata]